MTLSKTAHGVRSPEAKSPWGGVAMRRSDPVIDACQNGRRDPPHASAGTPKRKLWQDAVNLLHIAIAINLTSRIASSRRSLWKWPDVLIPITYTRFSFLRFNKSIEKATKERMAEAASLCSGSHLGWAPEPQALKCCFSRLDFKVSGIF